MRIMHYDVMHYEKVYCICLRWLVLYVCGWRGFFQVFQVTTEGGGEEIRTVFRLTVDLKFRI